MRSAPTLWTLRRAILALGLSGFLMLASGCAFSIGGGNTEEVQLKTWGQQLLDLKKALDEGALTQQEFENAKRKVIRAALKS
ncbi:MAG TPA: hypothetical protein VMU54_14770 [Planctomycetota bacterium]|nr:hypothetical protein [Planctomycetota bacterium]